MLAAISMTASAQGGTNSPYSQFGLGVLSDQSQSASRGMNGGGETTSIIYVTVGKDTKPEFTEVVR